jgi:hypothetical protein
MTKRTIKTDKVKVAASALKMRMSTEATAMVIKTFERAIEAVRSGIAHDATDLGIICAHVFAIAEHIDGEAHYFEMGLSGDFTNQDLKELLQEGDEFPWVEVCSERT